jgi:AmiR/NasT family two-component response regulator
LGRIRQQDDADRLAEQVGALQDKVDNLELALEHSRDIGVAIGIIMATERLARDDAFGMLRTVSQHQNRKLFLVAAEVIETGTLPTLEKPQGEGWPAGCSGATPP